MRVPEPAKRPSGVAIGLFTLRPRTANGFWRFYLAPSVLVAVIFFLGRCGCVPLYRFRWGIESPFCSWA